LRTRAILIVRSREADRRGVFCVFWDFSSPPCPQRRSPAKGAADFAVQGGKPVLARTIPDISGLVSSAMTLRAPRSELRVPHSALRAQTRRLVSVTSATRCLVHAARFQLNAAPSLCACTGTWLVSHARSSFFRLVWSFPPARRTRFRACRGGSGCRKGRVETSTEAADSKTATSSTPR
jgi:hypothetical protein